MKPVVRSLSVLILILILSFNMSCDILTPLDQDEIVEKQAWDVIIEAHMMKQIWFYHFFNIYSNHYARGQLFVYEPTKKQIALLLEEYSQLMSYKSAVEAAVDSLQSSGAISIAKPAAATGIFSALKDFFTAGSEVNENNRKRLLMIASNMNQADRNQLYDELVVDEWKKEIGTADEFWTKLGSGDLDDRASTLYKNFYDGANALLNPFTGLANDKNLTPGKMLAKDGINLCNKGMDVVIESGKLIVPGLDKATDLLESGQDYYEKAQTMVDKPMNAVVDEIKSRAAGKLADMIDIDSRLDAEGAGKYVKVLAELTLGSDDPAELIENGIDAGIAKITSPDQSIKPDIAIAENNSPSTGLPDYIIGVGNYIQQANAFIMTLPSGSWDIAAKTQTGKTNIEPEITITEGETAEVICEKNDDFEDSLNVSLHYFNKIICAMYSGESIGGGYNVSNTDDSTYALKWIGKSFTVEHERTSETYYPESGNTYIYKNIVSVEGIVSIASFDKLEITATVINTFEQYVNGNIYIRQLQRISGIAVPEAYSKKDSYGEWWTYFIINSQYNSDLLPVLANHLDFEISTTYFISSPDNPNLGQVSSEHVINTLGTSGIPYVEIRLGYTDYRLTEDY